MMTRFEEYFVAQINSFNEYHSNLLKEVTTEDIHKLRTTLKKLKAFNILLDGCLFREKDFPIGFKELFKLSGEIRDIQIQQLILDEYEDEYKYYLSELYQTKLTDFKIKDNFDIEIQYMRDKLMKVENYHIDDQLIDNIQSQIQLVINNIHKNIENVSVENLHEIRIQLKRLYYTYLMIGNVEFAEKLNGIQDVIGLWHDYDVTISRMKEFDETEYVSPWNHINNVTPLLVEKRDSFYEQSLKLLETI